MRLIDADALMQTLGITDMDCEKCGWGSHGFCMRGGDFTDACEAIENAPTIEPERKTGNWEVIEAESWKGGAYARCSECGTGFAFGAFFEPDEFKFCPECGAEMEVNDDHND